MSGSSHTGWMGRIIISRIGASRAHVVPLRVCVDLAHDEIHLIEGCEG
eukprot:COSAG01_NODE_1388_length_10504_cov_15.302835_1_plen_47_part_10